MLGSLKTFFKSLIKPKSTGRSAQEIFNLAISEGDYRPRHGMCRSILHLRIENKITLEEYLSVRKEIKILMEALPSVYLSESIAYFTSLRGKEVEEACFKIYRNWKNRLKILKGLHKGLPNFR